MSCGRLYFLKMAKIIGPIPQSLLEPCHCAIKKESEFPSLKSGWTGNWLVPRECDRIVIA